jgi:hypothetical protein
MTAICMIRGLLRQKKVAEERFRDHAKLLRDELELLASTQCDATADIKPHLEKLHSKALRAASELIDEECRVAMRQALVGKGSPTDWLRTGSPKNRSVTDLTVLEFRASGDGVSFPWELLPICEEEARLESFLGSHAVGHRSPTLDPDLPVDPIEAFGDRFQVGAAFYSRNVGQWDDFLQTQHAEKYPDIRKCIAIDELPKLEAASVALGEGTFLRFLRAKHHIKHFACHAETTHQTSASTELIVDERFHAPIHGLLDQVKTGLKTPVVFLNVCGAAQTLIQPNDSIAAAMLGQGARFVVGTIARVPSMAAREFAHKFYDLFITGATGLQCIANARRAMFTSGSYSPLIYSYYGDATAHLDLASLRPSDVRQLAKTQGKPSEDPAPPESKKASLAG